MKKFLAVAFTLLATPAMPITLDDAYAIVGDIPAPICTTISAVEKWFALYAARRDQEAEAMPDCVLLNKGDKILIVERDVAGYMRGLWTAPSGTAIDIWTRSYPNMTEMDFAIFNCQHHEPKCTREVFDAVKGYMSPFDKWEPSE